MEIYKSFSPVPLANQFGFPTNQILYMVISHNLSIIWVQQWGMASHHGKMA